MVSWAELKGKIMSGSTSEVRIGVRRVGGYLEYVDKSSPSGNEEYALGRRLLQRGLISNRCGCARQMLRKGGGGATEASSSPIVVTRE